MNNSLKLLVLCEKDAEMLKRLRKIQNEILINCAYHQKNKEDQLARMRQAGATKHEEKTVIRTYDLQQKYGNRLLERFEMLLAQMEGDFEQNSS